MFNKPYQSHFRDTIKYARQISFAQHLISANHLKSDKNFNFIFKKIYLFDTLLLALLKI